MRAALTSAGARLLEAVLAGDGDGYAGPHAKCPAGHQAGYAGVRYKRFTTVLGPVRISAGHWYHSAACEHGFAPRDAQLEVGGATESPRLAEMIALADAEVSFAPAAGLITALAGITVSPRTVERSAEATGAAARVAGQAEAEAEALWRARSARCPGRAGPRHAVCRDRRHRGAGAAQRDRGPGRQGRRRQGPHPRGQARPAVHRLAARRQGPAGDGPRLIELRLHLRWPGRTPAAGRG
jgi:hypothetical protein